MRGQLVADQIREMKINQLHATQGLQRTLDWRLHHLKLAPRAGNPQEAVGGQLGRQVGNF